MTAPRMRDITLYDTTLRDGAQTVGVSFSLQDKLRITAELDRLGIDYIEGGWPGSNPKDEAYFREVRSLALGHARVVAFGSTRRPGTRCADDPQLRALVESGAQTVTIVAKTWDFHVTAALGISLDENLDLVGESIAFLREHGREVFLDAEHFFDGHRDNPEYALSVLDRAREAGAAMLVLCDTNGGTLPADAERITREACARCDVPIGVHFHNDAGVAVANSILAVQAGAVSVQGTMNGYGERCGNCDLAAAIPNLVLKMGYACAVRERLAHLTEVSRFVSETANLAHNERAPYVGDSAFAHKGGIHVSALGKDTRTYEHIDPSLVGNRRRVLVSELSGKSNIEMKAAEFGIALGKDVTLSKEVLRRIKCLEDKGFQFEAAEGSFELLLRESIGEYRPFFKLLGFRVITEKRGAEDVTCEATIKVEVDGRERHTAANGNGPVAALDNALRKALVSFFPDIEQLQLSDYKVRVLNEKQGTGAAVRVLIDHKRQAEHWGTVGVSANIIEASWHALVDGIEYMLFKGARRAGS
ncbi:MAG TPA: citramalate synthase [Spirochaetota bacterium]|nr:citramalate synthase [Spirochaetota bacterium]HPI22582.1 citramalate synthase [Spirochaetota bacterium]HPU87147.1 citramalate synthase [Spirochaetota bacterium]